MIEVSKLFTREIAQEVATAAGVAAIATGLVNLVSRVIFSVALSSVAAISSGALAGATAEVIDELASDVTDMSRVGPCRVTLLMSMITSVAVLTLAGHSASLALYGSFAYLIGFGSILEYIQTL